MQMTAKPRIFTMLAVIIALGLGSRSSAATVPSSWNPTAAAAYLDQRAAWWTVWPRSARDHGTYCISCHTALPYLLARPALRAVVHDGAPSAGETKLLDNVEKRVSLWNEEQPYYDEQSGANKTAQSRGTESVLNALILGSSDARAGKLSDETRIAFENMWALQGTTGDESGAWPWLDFGNEPFEARDSLFYGACLAAVAIGSAPEKLRTKAEVQGNIKRLREYLNREYTNQSLINQVALLWASERLPGLLTSQKRSAIIDAVLNKQLPDGGWSLSELAWSWRGTSLRSIVKLWTQSEYSLFQGKSDGYATGLIVFVFKQSGLTSENSHIQKGLAWLQRSQAQDGRWPAYSLNHRSEGSSGTGLFMSDAATAYAVLALTQPDQQ